MCFYTLYVNLKRKIIFSHPGKMLKIFKFENHAFKITRFNGFNVILMTIIILIDFNAMSNTIIFQL